MRLCALWEGGPAHAAPPSHVLVVPVRAPPRGDEGLARLDDPRKAVVRFEVNAPPEPLRLLRVGPVRP